MSRKISKAARDLLLGITGKKAFPLCETCHWWRGQVGERPEKGDVPAQLYCWRYPPVPMQAHGGVTMARPVTERDSGCGEHSSIALGAIVDK